MSREPASIREPTPMSESPVIDPPIPPMPPKPRRVSEWTTVPAMRKRIRDLGLLAPTKATKHELDAILHDYDMVQIQRWRVELFRWLADVIEAHPLGPMIDGGWYYDHRTGRLDRVPAGGRGYSTPGQAVAAAFGEHITITYNFMQLAKLFEASKPSDGGAK